MFSKVLSRSIVSVLGFVFILSLCIGLPGAIANDDDDCNLYGCNDDCEFTTDFRIEDCTFETTGSSPYFILEPGYQLVLESDEEKAVETVLQDTKWINLGGRIIETRVVEERAWEENEDEENGDEENEDEENEDEENGDEENGDEENGDEENEDGELVLVEISRNWFAICKKTNDVYYFGEFSRDCDLEETGGFDPNDESKCADGTEPDDTGSWEAGVNGAQPGIIMPGTFLLGAKYFQEIAENDEAVDRGQNVKMGLTVKTEAGTFEDCVEVIDTNPAEDVCSRSEGDPKKYCPGVGLVQDEDLKLVEYGFVDDDDDLRKWWFEKFRRLHNRVDDNDDDLRKWWHEKFRWLR